MATPVLAQDGDIPGAVANIELVPTGSLIIPMDNALQQELDGNPPFNVKAYGYVAWLLWNNVPVKWAIKSAKLKDGIDFSVNATRVRGDAENLGPAVFDFSGGPFIVVPPFVAQALALYDTFDGDPFPIGGDPDIDPHARLRLPDQRRRDGGHPLLAPATSRSSS